MDFLGAIIVQSMARFISSSGDGPFSFTTSVCGPGASVLSR